MSDFSKEQAQIDALATRRMVHKGAAHFVTASQTKDFADALVKRIEGLRDSYVEKYDATDPADAVSFARFQEARKVCDKILLDLDPESCKKAIEMLDKEIKTIHDAIEKKKSAKSNSGFNSLRETEDK